MSVNPGFGGQKFIRTRPTRSGVRGLMLDEAGSDAVLEVDGGINRDTIHAVWSAGADTFVAGNAIFAVEGSARRESPRYAHGVESRYDHRQQWVLVARSSACWPWDSARRRT